MKIIDLDINRRRISLSIKQAAEGGVVAAEFQEHFGEHAYDAEGNYIGAVNEDVAADQDEAWAQYYSETGEAVTPAPMTKAGLEGDQGGLEGDQGGLEGDQGGLEGDQGALEVDEADLKLTKGGLEGDEEGPGQALEEAIEDRSSIHPPGVKPVQAILGTDNRPAASPKSGRLLPSLNECHKLVALPLP